MARKSNIIFLILTVFTLDVQAQSKSSKGTVDLQDEDIVGFQRRPKIFLEFETHSPTMDSILYRRDDFNRNQLEDARYRFRAQVPEKKR